MGFGGDVVYATDDKAHSWSFKDDTGFILLRSGYLSSLSSAPPLSRVADNQTAYVLAGSFVGFLIEKYGLPKFRTLYETGNYEDVYGKSLPALENEWRTSIEAP